MVANSLAKDQAAQDEDNEDTENKEQLVEELD